MNKIKNLIAIIEIEYDNACDNTHEVPDDLFYQKRLALTQSVLTKCKAGKFKFTADEKDLIYDALIEAIEAVKEDEDFFGHHINPDDIKELLKKF